jgi:hypothetical protein
LIAPPSVGRDGQGPVYHYSTMLALPKIAADRELKPSGVDHVKPLLWCSTATPWEPDAARSLLTPGGGVDTDPTVQTCWDADRLDLGRVGIKPHPDFLSPFAAKLIEPAYRWSRGGPAP